MKTFIIATILSAGVLLRPALAPSGNKVLTDENTTSSFLSVTGNANANPLLKTEMETLQGGGIVECAGYIDTDGDRHEMCCLNLWIFRVCGDLNMSACQRLVSSLL